MPTPFTDPTCASSGTYLSTPPIRFMLIVFAYPWEAPDCSPHDYALICGCACHTISQASPLLDIRVHIGVHSAFIAALGPPRVTMLAVLPLRAPTSASNVSQRIETSVYPAPPCPLYPPPRSPVAVRQQYASARTTPS